MPFPDRVAMLLPPLRMGQREPVHALWQVAIPLWPDDGIPVVGHDAVRQESHGDSLTRLPQYPFKGGIVFVIDEELHPSVRPIQGRDRPARWALHVTVAPCAITR
jgi:hypothetical protein